MLAVEAEGRAIETIEGMARGHDLHPLQRKFLEHAALQCGFCTPGLLVAAKALLDRNPSPTETETRYWLAGNLCRCTGYDKIIRAVLDAACEAPVVGSQRAVTRDSPGIMSLSSVPSTDKNSYGVLELKNSASPSGPPPPRLFVGKNTPG
jgi:xanthine dehydrogenase iron-sulfur cluster and FAD-binding subunit A